jgi:hypothetical protein
MSITENLNDVTERDRPPAPDSTGENVPKTKGDAPGSELARHGDPSLTSTRSGRPGVEWVRPTELAQRAGSTILSAGAEAHKRLHTSIRHAVRDGGTQLRDALWHRETALTDDETAATPRGSVRREGVGR